MREIVCGSKPACGMDANSANKQLDRRWRRSIIVDYLTLSALLGLCIACQTSTPVPAGPLSPKSLCGLELEQLGQMDEAQVRQWLEGEYGTVKRSADLAPGVIKLWAQEKNGVSPAAFLREDRLYQVLQSLKGGPNFGRVVADLGEPDSVSGSALLYETVRYSVGLDYPKLGLTLYHDGEGNPRDLTHDGRLEVQMKKDYAVDLVQCYVPRSSIQQVLENGFQLDPKNVQINLNRRKPWPGFGGWVPLEP